MMDEKMALPFQFQTGNSSRDTGLARLNELGYKQELKRDLSVVSNFCVFVFDHIGADGHNHSVQHWAQLWRSCGIGVWVAYCWTFTMFVGLSMAEICSSYPTSGGLYYWSAKLAGPSWAPFASWLTGWFDLTVLFASWLTGW
ncbi:bidirectional amino acid transporter 1 [Actinidia rufa]|uniref:Bidirectional amino acid transporter 1 n=1 Tax=Actinidia rufa TaxID=165716 RepID=A0A7J0DDN6_9ERIC|nr:bidirectional amino acid transporter 1 [Actinidia rufa]